jgi:hypothetical protein
LDPVCENTFVKISTRSLEIIVNGDKWLPI